MRAIQQHAAVTAMSEVLLQVLARDWIKVIFQIIGDFAPHILAIHDHGFLPILNRLREGFAESNLGASISLIRNRARSSLTLTFTSGVFSTAAVSATLIG